MPHSTYLPEQMGTATVRPDGAFEAGSLHEFTLTYTAGYFGIDDTGSLKIVHRFASDMGRPQFHNPAAANYVTAEASNGAVLHLEYDTKRNIRPWDKTLYIKVVRGFLREGDKIQVRFGDQRQGGPGIRVQTFCERTFEFRVLVDAFAAYHYVELPTQPVIAIVPGRPVRYKAILPTVRRPGQRFRLCIKGEDKWGNPSNLCRCDITLRASLKIINLPARITFAEGVFSIVLEDLFVDTVGEVVIELLDEAGDHLGYSNPLRVVADTALLPYWGDLHGQSEETIGTNSARDFYDFARNHAFLDACSHQGNDFQITTPFWRWLNELSAEFNVDGRFITFPGYEWSGNTGLGGDRNVLYRNEGQRIHRSSHALVDDRSDAATDAHSAEALFNAIKDEECVVFAHIGGRYADIKMAHNIRLERAVEIHSAWGTFEWLMEDAFEQGYRVGIVANSDGHKGRPGASHPGATKFGAYGGLTCMLASEFSRAGLMQSLYKRHHYATTGCRIFLETQLGFDTPAQRFAEDPNLGAAESKSVCMAMMGDIVRSVDDQATLYITAHGSAPIERIQIRNGLERLETIRPFGEHDLGRRIRVIWEGSEYRGRGRETIWDGAAELSGNGFQKISPINRYNLDNRFDQVSINRLEWDALTTGGFGGFDAWLEDRDTGILTIDTALVQAKIPVRDIGIHDLIFDSGGIGRRIRVFRMPDKNATRKMNIQRRLPLRDGRDGRDNGFYINLIQEDGHQAWSSPVYVFR